MRFLKNITTKYGALIISAMAIYILIYSVALNIPFHSDDYGYFSQGLSLENRINHYLSWSGRLITDFTSSYLLNLFSFTVYSAINSLVFVVFLVVVSLLPRVVFKDKNYNNKSALTLWLLFITYWLSNPNLGQTSFWLVGSANYLWPLMWASFYIYNIFYLLSNNVEKNIKSVLLIWFLGIFAGLSNEAMGVSIVFFSFLLLVIYIKNRFYATHGFLASLFGFLVLYLSPGNYKRLEHPAFQQWSEKNLFEKVSEHIFFRFPEAISNYGFAFFVLWLIAAIFCLTLLTKEKVDDCYKRKLLFPTLFFGLSILSVLVFVKSPAMPLRSLNTGLYFIIVGLSFLIYFEVKKLPKIGSILISIVIGFCLLFFIPSYIWFYIAIDNTSKQSQVRENIILESKLSGNSVVEIPDWYFTRLLKPQDKFDTYRSDAMPNYYGVKEIIWTPVSFDYSVLLNDKSIKVNQKLFDELELSSIYSYKEFGAAGNKLIFEFTDSLLNYIEDGDDILYMHLYKKNEAGFVNADIEIKVFDKIGRKYYYIVDLNGLEIDDVSQVNFGFYNSQNKENSASFGFDFGKISNKT